MFYTDGEKLWDENHNLQIANLGGDESSAQPAAICILPKCPLDSFVIFSNPTSNTGQSNAVFGTISYRIYDKISKTFTTSNNLPYPVSVTNTNAGEGMLIVPSRNDRYTFYLISRLVNPSSNNWFVVHKIDSNGVFYQGKYDLGPPSFGEFFGNLTYSEERYPTTGSDYVEIAVTTSNLVYTLRFNTLTGILDSYNLINNNPSGDVFYDVEYSPNGAFLYYSTYWMNVNLFQYEFITSNNVMNIFSNRGGGGLKKASDGYVYHITKGVTNQITEIGRILTPNSVMPSGNMTGFYQTNILSKPSITVSLNFPEFITIPSNGDLGFCSTSIKQVKDDNNLILSPNPSSSFIYFQLNLNDDVSKLQIVDISGKEIHNYAFTQKEDKVKIDIRNLKEGVYFISIESTERGIIKTGKIVKVENIH